MNPVLATRLRRQWPLFAAAVVFLIFMLVHLLVVQPMVGRWRHALERAASLGVILDPAHPAGRARCRRTSSRC